MQKPFPKSVAPQQMLINVKVLCKVLVRHYFDNNKMLTKGYVVFI